MTQKGYMLPVKILRILLITALVIDVLALVTIWFWLPRMNAYAFGWEYFTSTPKSDAGTVRFMYSFFIWCGLACGWCLVEGNGLLCSVLKLEAFTHGNAKRLIRIAIAMCLIAVAFIAKMTVLPSLSTLMGLGIFFGLGLLFWVLSLLFRHAADIKSDYDLTI